MTRRGSLDPPSKPREGRQRLHVTSRGRRSGETSRRAFPTPRWAARAGALAAAAVLATACAGCSIKRFAFNSVANSLTSGPDVFGTEDDPELVRDAVPFGLKLMESLLQVVPEHRGLLRESCRGFTQYAFAFVQLEADAIEFEDRARAERMRERALRLYLRARDYGLRGLERRRRGITERLRTDPQGAAAALGAKDLPFIFWTAVAWGAAISVARDRPELVVDLGAVRALMKRALALDEAYEGGIVHEAMILFEAIPLMGGSPERAREHFRRAVELSRGMRAAPYVILAESVCVMEQDRAEFRRLLTRALEVDPDANPAARLETIMLQRKARLLLARADHLFLEDEAETEMPNVEEPR